MQICCIEPLCVSRMMAENSSSHPVVGSLMFAMASVSKVIVVALRPSLQVHYNRLLSGGANTLPLLAWNFVNIRITETERNTDPVLLFARDQYVCFLQVTCFHLLLPLKFAFKFVSVICLYIKYSHNSVSPSVCMSQT